MQGKKIMKFKSIADIVVVVVCLDDVNFHVNVSGAQGGELLLSFNDNKLQWTLEATDTKQQMPKEID